jgi:hypothetical protein
MLTATSCGPYHPERPHVIPMSQAAWNVVAQALAIAKP